MTVSAIVVAFNSGPALVRCLRSLEDENDGDLEVLVVNNGERGPEIGEAERMGFVRIVEPGGNAGFAAGCNKGARHATGDVLVFLNPDTVVTRGAIAALARTVADRSIAIAMPRLRLLSNPELLNSSGNVVHITGLAWPGGYGERADQLVELRDIPYASGAAMAIRRDLFRELGGFTEQLFLYQEDLELSWRARMRGLRIVVDPAADVCHDYEFEPDKRKLYFLERNRLVFVLSSFSPRLLALLAPVLVSTELALLLVAAEDGWAKEMVEGWLWCMRNARWLARHRRTLQRRRAVPDRELARHLASTVDPAMLRLPGGVRLLDAVVASYWSLVRKVL